ncbi:MAG: hypothetical protein AAFR52_16750, partial [Pseudomonadota bacterium]
MRNGTSVTWRGQRVAGLGRVGEQRQDGMQRGVEAADGAGIRRFVRIGRGEGRGAGGQRALRRLGGQRDRVEAAEGGAVVEPARGECLVDRGRVPGLGRREPGQRHGALGARRGGADLAHGVAHEVAVGEMGPPLDPHGAGLAVDAGAQFDPRAPGQHHGAQQGEVDELDAFAPRGDGPPPGRQRHAHQRDARQHRLAADAVIAEPGQALGVEDAEPGPGLGHGCAAEQGIGAVRRQHAEEVGRRAARRLGEALAVPGVGGQAAGIGPGPGADEARDVDIGAGGQRLAGE